MPKAPLGPQPAGRRSPFLRQPGLRENSLHGRADGDRHRHTSRPSRGSGNHDQDRALPVDSHTSRPGQTEVTPPGAAASLGAAAGAEPRPAGSVPSPRLLLATLPEPQADGHGGAPTDAAASGPGDREVPERPGKIQPKKASPAAKTENARSRPQDQEGSTVPVEGPPGQNPSGRQRGGSMPSLVQGLGTCGLPKRADSGSAPPWPWALRGAPRRGPLSSWKAVSVELSSCVF